jgi:uncharacterized protein
MKIWVDLENSPHVLFFGPIIEELNKRGHRITVTARDFAQTVELARHFGLEFLAIGRQWGKNNAEKVLGMLWRAGQLWKFGRGKGFDLAVSHLSRSQVIAARALGLPIVVGFDYEHIFTSVIQRWFDRVLIPQSVPKEVAIQRGIPPEKITQYPGLKEEIYLYGRKFDDGVLRELDLDPGRIVVTFRPPSDTAHYQHPRSEAIFDRVVERILAQGDVVAVVLPRSAEQRKRVRRLAEEHPGKFVIPAQALDGPALIGASDLVVSGGGTMNREAAVMGVPVYSIFGGEIGAVDRALEAAGKLVMVRSVEQVDQMVFRKRPPGSTRTPEKPLVRDTVVEAIEAFDNR